MDNDDIEQVYQQLLQEETIIYFKTIKDELQEILRNVENKMIYQYYKPSKYQRTNYFLDNIKVNIDEENGKLYLYNDMNEDAPYISAVDGSPQFKNVPYWIENGHNDDSQVINEYHHYESRHYLEELKKEIESKFKDLDVQIINESSDDILYDLDYF